MANQTTTPIPIPASNPSPTLTPPQRVRPPVPLFTASSYSTTSLAGTRRSPRNHAARNQSYATPSSGSSIPVTPQTVSPLRNSSLVRLTLDQNSQLAASAPRSIFRDVMRYNPFAVNPLPSHLDNVLVSMMRPDNESIIEFFYTSFLSFHLDRLDRTAALPIMQVVKVDMDSLEAEGMRSWRDSPFATLLEARRGSSRLQSASRSSVSLREESSTAGSSTRAPSVADAGLGDARPQQPAVPTAASSSQSGTSNAGVRHPDSMIVAEVMKAVEPEASHAARTSVQGSCPPSSPRKRRKVSQSSAPFKSDIWRVASFVTDYKFSLDYQALLYQVIAYGHQANFAVGTPFAAVFRRENYARIIIFSPNVFALEVSKEAQTHVRDKGRSNGLSTMLSGADYALCEHLEQGCGIPVRQLDTLTPLLSGRAQPGFIYPPNSIASLSQNVFTTNPNNLRRLSNFAKLAFDILFEMDSRGPLSRIVQDIEVLTSHLSDLISPIGIALGEKDLEIILQKLRGKVKARSENGENLGTNAILKSSGHQHGQRADANGTSTGSLSGGVIPGKATEFELSSSTAEGSALRFDEKLASGHVHYNSANVDTVHTPLEEDIWPGDSASDAGDSSDAGFDPLLYDIVGQNSYVALLTPEQMDILAPAYAAVCSTIHSSQQATAPSSSQSQVKEDFADRWPAGLSTPITLDTKL